MLQVSLHVNKVKLYRVQMKNSACFRSCHDWLFLFQMKHSACFSSCHDWLSARVCQTSFTEEKLWISSIDTIVTRELFRRKIVQIPLPWVIIFGNWSKKTGNILSHGVFWEGHLLTDQDLQDAQFVSKRKPTLPLRIRRVS